MRSPGRWSAATAFDDLPPTVDGGGRPHPAGVRPVRRGLLRPLVALPPAASASTSCRPTPRRHRSSGCPRPAWPGAPPSTPSTAPCTSRATAGRPTSSDGASNAGAARGPTGSWSRAARTNGSCPRSGSAPGGKLSYRGQRHRAWTASRAGVAGAALGPPHRDDGQPPGAREGVCRLLGPGRVAGRSGRLRPRRAVRARPERRPHRGGDRRGVRSGHGEIHRRCRTMCGPIWRRPTVVVLPSYREGIPRVAMEAAAMGRPVAAYDIRGVREVIDPGLGSAGAPRATSGADRCGRGLIGDADRCAELGEPLPEVGGGPLLGGPGRRAAAGPRTRPMGRSDVTR